MGLLSALGRNGMRALRSGEMFGSRAAGAGDDFVLGGMRGLSDTTPPDMAQRIRAFQSADARDLRGGMQGGPAQFHMEKEMLAQQLSGGDPQIMQAIRSAQSPEELDAIVSSLPLPRGGADPRIQQMGLSPTTPGDIIDRIETARRRPWGT